MSVKIDKGSALSGINLTSLIDVVFLLLIFFLVATRFAEEERELEVLLPEASEAKALTDKPRELFINIDRRGRYFVSNKIVSLKQLDGILKVTRINNPARASVVIRADRRVVWRYVVDAMNSCNKAKIFDYRVTTRKTGK